MKKFLTFVLLFCTTLSCTFTTTFAAESKQEDIGMKKQSDIVPYNMDVWSTNGLPVYITSKTIQVNPGAGKNLKVHFYLSKLYLERMDFKIYLSTSYGDKLIAHWNTEGDHWADVVTNTSNTSYRIRMVVPAYINGAFYTEP